MDEKKQKEHIDVLSFVRRDGPATAPFVFLSIEDGGSFVSVEECESHFRGDEAWEPTIREKRELGKPGQIISKIMCGTATGYLILTSFFKYRIESRYVFQSFSVLLTNNRRTDASTQRYVVSF